ncbi:MAG: hypothetical protein EOP39_09355 [Rubrivivax sp.]|nr:MAG: hypothetical protein EOP39_09355 [Rubrivivax sp.]
MDSPCITLDLDSGFGALEGDALCLVRRRYADRGLTLPHGHFSSRHDGGDVVCSARDGEHVIGTLTVRFDNDGELMADGVFGTQLAAWRAAGDTLCEFGSLALDRHSHDPKRLLAQLFHLAYLHAHRRAGCRRGVIEVHPRHVAFYRRWLNWTPCGEPRHHPRVDAPAVLMSFQFSAVREQIARWGGQPERLAEARCLYPLAWDACTEAVMLARIA